MILDGSPTITLTSDKTSIHEGEECNVLAEVDDDRGIDAIEKVVFFMDGDIILIDETYPFKLTFQGPERMGGKTLAISAQITDTGGNSVYSEALHIRVSPLLTPHLLHR